MAEVRKVEFNNTNSRNAKTKAFSSRFFFLDEMNFDGVRENSYCRPTYSVFVLCSLGRVAIAP